MSAYIDDASYITKKNEFPSDLTIQVAEKLFKEHRADGNEIDCILFCMQSADFFLLTTASVLQNVLGIPTINDAKTVGDIFNLINNNSLS